MQIEFAGQKEETLPDGTALNTLNLRGPIAAEVFGGGISNAMTGLSQMVGRDIKITQLSFKKVMVKDIPNLFGGPENLIIGVYLSITGYANGHMVVIYEPQTAFDLIDLLLSQPQGTTRELSDMEQSVLGEVGNIMGSFFLNHIANTTGLSFQPSPPAVMMDMAGAILDSALGNVLEIDDYTYIVETTFGSPDRQVTGAFLIVPAPEMEFV